MLTLGALLLLSRAAEPGRAAPETSERFGAADLFSLEAAADPQISPDGELVAYVRRSADIMTDRVRSAIWLIDVQTGLQWPIAATEGGQSQPRWSHDGKSVAFVSSAGEDSSQLYVFGLKQTRSRLVTSTSGGAANLAWSPDDRTIAFTARAPADEPLVGITADKPAGAKWAPELRVYDKLKYRTDDDGYLKPGSNHIFLADVAGGAPRQLTSGPFNDSGPLSWAPDGSRIIFSADRRPDWEFAGRESDVHAVEIAGGRITQLTSRNGPESQPVVSPDGRWIAFTGFDDDEHDYHVSQLYVMSSDGGPARSLTSADDRPFEDPIWSADSRSLYASFDDRASRKVARIRLDGRKTALLSGLAGQMYDRPYVGGTFSIARDGTIAATTGNWARPPDVSLSAKGRDKQLTHLNGFLQGKQLGTVRKIDCRSADGTPIEAWITLPPDYRDGDEVPLILEIHGGPHNAYGPYFSFDDQLYAAAGFAVLSANPRGSTSYGEAFGDAIFRAFPGKDYDDLMAAVDAAVAAGFADPDRLFVTGGSGGGILTAWIIGKTARFRAAAVQKPAINYASFVLTSDQPDYYARYWFGRLPWDDPAYYWARSPISQAGHIRTPTLIIGGDLDFRTPAGEAEQLYTALKLQSVPALLIKVPGASHFGIAARPSQAAARVSAIVDWFRRFDPRWGKEIGRAVPSTMSTPSSRR